MAQFRPGSMLKMASDGLRTKISDLRQWVERQSSKDMPTNDSNPSVRNEQMTQHVAQVINEIKEDISQTTADTSDSKKTEENSKTLESQEEFTPIKAQERRLFEVKARLLQDGYYGDSKYSSRVLTGKLDADMTNAVKAFQEKNGLDATGVVDAQTYQAIMAIDLSQGGALDRNSEEAVALNSENYDSAVDRVLAFADFYEGYYEKPDAKDLNSKAGSGSGDFTRFGRDYTIMTQGNGWGGDFSGSTWCQMFVEMMFVEAFGEENAKQMLGGHFWSDCTHAAETLTKYYNNFDGYDKDEIIDFADYRFEKEEGIKNLKFLKTPQVGDLVFFKYGEAGNKLSHVALVHSIEGANLYTIEGNAGAKGDGDRVRIVKYKQVGNSFIGANYGKSLIVGFSRPDWSVAESVVNNANDVETLKKYQDVGNN